MNEPDLRSHLRLFTDAVGKLIDSTRSKDDPQLALRNLQQVLETLRLIINTFHCGDVNTAEIKTSAVELRTTLSQYFENEGTSNDDIVAAVASLVAAVKYAISLSMPQLQRSTSNAGTASLPPSRGAPASPSTTTSACTDDTDLMATSAMLKENVEVFVRKCSEILVYSRDAAMEREAILTRFFDIIDSLKRITSAPGIDVTAIKATAAPLVTLIQQMQTPGGYDADFRRQLSTAVLTLARAVKGSVNTFLLAKVDQRQLQMSIAFQKDSETGEERLRLHTEDGDNVRQPLGFTHYIPTVNSRANGFRTRVNTDMSASSQADSPSPVLISPSTSNSQLTGPLSSSTLDAHTDFGQSRRQVNVLHAPNQLHRKSRYIAASGHEVDLHKSGSESFLQAHGLNDVATTIGLQTRNDVVDDEESGDITLEVIPDSPFTHSTNPVIPPPPPPSTAPDGSVIMSGARSTRSSSQESLDDVIPDRGRISPSEELEADLEISMFFTPHVWTSDEARKQQTQQLHVASTSDLSQSGNLQLGNAMHYIYNTIKRRVLKPKLPGDGPINIVTMMPSSSATGRTRQAAMSDGETPSSPSLPSSATLADDSAGAAGTPLVPDVEDTVETTENDKVVLVLKVKGHKTRVEAGTVDILVERLANEDAQDHEYMRTFLLTFRHFMKPHELMQKAMSRIHVTTSTNPTPEELEYFEKWGWRIQYRAINFIKKWMESCWFDFHNEPHMLKSLDELIQLIQASPKIKNLARQIESTRAKQTELALTEERKRAEYAQNGGIRDAPVLSNLNMSDFMTMDLNSMCRQLTLIEFEYFRKVQPQELMIYLWGDPRENVKDSSELTANLAAYVNRFNQISFWVGTEICIVPILKKRIAVVERIIQLLKILREFNNFNVVMGIISGLNSASVQRLKKTWEGTSSRSLAILHDIEKTMDPASNYSIYRQIEGRKYPHFIPFFGLVLKDLIFANDGNPKLLPNGLVNFGKLRTLALLVERLALFQSNPYNIQKEDTVYDYCMRLIALSEDRLYKYSLLCEPRANNEQQQPVRLVDKWHSENIGFIEKWVGDL